MKRPLAHRAPPVSSRGTGGWFRDLADTTSTAIFVFRGRFIYVNHASEALSGFSAAELRRMTVWDLVHPEHHEVLRREARRPREAARRFELKIVRKDGEERWIDLSLGDLRIDGRRATAGTGFDITDRKLAELALMETDERLKLAQRAARSLSWEWEPKTDRLGFSEYADELFGFPVRELVHTGAQFRRFVHPDDQRRLDQALQLSLRTGDDLSVEIRVLPPDGSVRWVAEKALAVRDAAGSTAKLIGVAHDITERKIAEEALFQEKERALVTLASIADGVIRTDARGAVDYLNPVAQRLTGWTLAEAYGRSVEEVYRVVDDVTAQPIPHPVARCLEQARNIVATGDRHLLRRDGVRFAVNDSAAPIRNRAGSLTGSILVFKDVSRLRQIEEQVERLTSHDPLTGLINRRGFEARLREAFASAHSDERRHALAYIDLDQFRLVNDTCGHAAGDQLLLQVTSLIESSLGDRDLLGRLGGDEFGILMWDRTAAEARSQLQRVVDEVSAHRFSWHERIFAVALSAGLVPIDAGDRHRADLLSAADAACQVAKERGGNRIHAYQPGDTTLAERHGQMQWISRIHKAFDDNRLSIYRQRIEPLTPEAEPAFHELFIRFLDTAGRVVEPTAFIPAAEKYGLITAIDRWMVGSALDHLAARGRRPRRRRHTHFGINLSGQSIGEREFLDFVIEQFGRTGAEPDQVYFEITETAAIADLPHATRFINVLRGMGCRFILDDFGKGLSSFSYLQNLPVDFLKIDGDFVRDLTTDPVQAALVGSIHEIGHVLGLRTIAEAVEDEATLEALREIGVDYAQGFFVSRPRPLTPPGRSGIRPFADPATPPDRGP